MFDYIIILELGNGTFLEKILSTAENHVKDEKMLMSVLSEPTKVLIQIHEGYYILCGSMIVSTLDF